MTAGGWGRNDVHEPVPEEIYESRVFKRPGIRDNPSAPSFTNAQFCSPGSPHNHNGLHILSSTRKLNEFTNNRPLHRNVCRRVALQTTNLRAKRESAESASRFPFPLKANTPIAASGWRVGNPHAVVSWICGASSRWDYPREFLRGVFVAPQPFPRNYPEHCLPEHDLSGSDGSRVTDEALQWSHFLPQRLSLAPILRSLFQSIHERVPTFV